MYVSYYVNYSIEANLELLKNLDEQSLCETKNW